jgi:hypothetical protein
VTAKRTSVAILPILGLALIFYALLWRRSVKQWVKIVATLILVGASLTFIAIILFVLKPPMLPQDLARHLRLSPDALVRLTTFFDNPALLAGHPWSHFADLTIESFWGFFGWKCFFLPNHLVPVFPCIRSRCRSDRHLIVMSLCFSNVVRTTQSYNPYSSSSK